MLRFIVRFNHVNFRKLTPDTIMSDRLTSSRLATLTESRIMSAQFMPDPTQYDSRASFKSSDSAMYFDYKRGLEVLEVHFGLFLS